MQCTLQNLSWDSRHVNAIKPETVKIGWKPIWGALTYVARYKLEWPLLVHPMAVSCFVFPQYQTHYTHPQMLKVESTWNGKQLVTSRAVQSWREEETHGTCTRIAAWSKNHSYDFFNEGIRAFENIRKVHSNLQISCCLLLCKKEINAPHQACCWNVHIPLQIILILLLASAHYVR